MRTAILVSAFLLALSLLAGTLWAGGAELTKLDLFVSPGGAANATVHLANDTAKPVRFKVSARVTGTGKKAKGKKVKLSVRLDPGESRDVDLAVPVPDSVTGSAVVSGKISWKKGHEDFAVGIVSSPTGGDAAGGEGGTAERPGADDPASGIRDRAKEYTGTITLSRPADRPGAYGMPEMMFPDLRLDTGDGDTWWLYGEEAWYLGHLMMQADLTETEATILGVDVDDLPVYRPDDEIEGGEVFDETGVKRLRPDARMRWLLVLEFDARGIEDPRKKIVAHREVLSGPLCRIAESKEVVVSDERSWQGLLTDAGIVLPDKGAIERMYGEMDVPPGVREDGLGRPEILFPFEIDFDAERVVAVFAGEKRSTGYRLFVHRVTKEDDGTVLVHYWLAEPSELEVRIAVATRPFAMVAIPKADTRVRFVMEEPREPGPIFPLTDEAGANGDER